MVDEIIITTKLCTKQAKRSCELTGVLGGSVPVFDEVILSTSLMNKIIKINDIPGELNYDLFVFLLYHSPNLS